MNLEKLLQHPEVTIIDVREPWELGMGKVEGAINIPLGQVPLKVEEFKNMAKPLVFICQSGNRSGMAVAILHAKGVQEVYNGGSWMDVRYLVNRMKTSNV
ncbi:MAG: rhodanese-like domain-containing protein [Haliscomenobacter sp.]